MKLKKVLAAVVAATMIMGMSVTTFAAPSTETATVTVRNVKENDAVVTAYQLVYYDEDTQEYKVVEAAEEKGYTVGGDDADIVAELAQDTTGLTSTELTEDDGDIYTGALTAGTYLILVTNTGSTIYNPMIVSLEVEYPDGVSNGAVDANSNYIVDDEVVYAKSVPDVPVTKVITDENGNIIGADGEYDDVYTGTEVYFKITGTVPSYSKQYDNESLTYVLTDTVSDGLTLDANLQQELQDQVGADNATVTVNSNVITIDYTREFILNHGGENVEVTYSATVNGKASNFDPATNKVTVTYSNSPSTSTTGKEDITKHYTFDLENAMVKVDSDNQEQTLTGAEFTLTNTEDTSKVIEGSTDENGNIVFEGLDAGTYTLKETKAPDGYQLSGKEYTVTITPEYDTAGNLTEYTVVIKDGDDEIGKMFYTKDNQDGTGTVANITNTELSSLPSTGGIGTTIFTVGGCAIMIAAAGLYFASRRKESK